MLTLTFTTEFPFVLAASLLGVGFGCFLGILSTCTSIYMFFKDKQIPVFMSIISSVTGLAVIIVALTFEWLQTSLGWQSAFKYSSLLSVPFLLAAFILCPKVNPTLQENHENHKDPEQNSCELPIKDSNRQVTISLFLNFISCNCINDFYHLFFIKWNEDNSAFPKRTLQRLWKLWSVSYCSESFRLLVWQAENTSSGQGSFKERSPVGSRFSELLFLDVPGTTTEQIELVGSEEIHRV